MISMCDAIIARIAINKFRKVQRMKWPKTWICFCANLIKLPNFFLYASFEIIPNEMNVNCYDVSTVLRQSKWVTRSVMLLITPHGCWWCCCCCGCFFRNFSNKFLWNENEHEEWETREETTNKHHNIQNTHNTKWEKLKGNSMWCW